MSEPEHVLENRRYWNEQAPQWVASGERNWRSQPNWGIWGLPESELQLLPLDMRGMDAVELGCGTGYVSAWMARRGARVTAIDNSEAQLATAARLAREHPLPIAFFHGNAEATPFAAESFDFAISEYGAAIWCNPNAWIAEAWRILRPGGRLVFLGHHPLAIVCSDIQGGPVTRTLQRPYFNLGTLDFRAVTHEPGGVEFNLTTSAWMQLFDAVGFDIERYQELQAPADASGDPFGVDAAWAHAFPSEQVWQLRKRVN